jgi:hypothetical protein
LAVVHARIGATYFHYFMQFDATEPFEIRALSHALALGPQDFVLGLDWIGGGMLLVSFGRADSTPWVAYFSMEEVLERMIALKC